jgi:cbb3-type cytochrome oxidase subunit 3
MQEALHFFPYKSLPLVALLLFALTFIVVFFWAYRPGSNDFYNEMAQKPLADLNNEISDEGSAL